MLQHLFLLGLLLLFLDKYVSYEYVHFMICLIINIGQNVYISLKLKRLKYFT